MAKIQHLLDKIRTAIYGKEVRGSLADGLEAINRETEDATEVAVNVEQRQDAVEQQFDDVLNEWTSDKPISNEETIAARTNRETGENHKTLGQRLDAENKKINAQLAQKVDDEFVENKLTNKVDRTEKGWADFNTFDEQTRAILQGLDPGQLNAVLGYKNVKNFNIDDEAVTLDKTNFLEKIEEPLNPVRLTGTIISAEESGVFLTTSSLTPTTFKIDLRPYENVKVTLDGSGNDRFRIIVMNKEVEDIGYGEKIKVDRVINLDNSISEVEFFNDSYGKQLFIYLANKDISAAVKVTSTSKIKSKLDLELNDDSVGIDAIDFLERKEEFVPKVTLTGTLIEVNGDLVTLNSTGLTPTTYRVDLKPFMNIKIKVVGNDNDRFRVVVMNREIYELPNPVVVDKIVNLDNSKKEVEYFNDAKGKQMFIYLANKKVNADIIVTTSTVRNLYNTEDTGENTKKRYDLAVNTVANTHCLISNSKVSYPTLSSVKMVNSNQNDVPVPVSWLYTTTEEPYEFYVSNGVPDRLEFLAKWKRELTWDGTRRPRNYSHLITEDGDIISVWQGSQLGERPDLRQDGRQNPIIYPAKDYSNPIEVDFGDRIKPTGWLQNTGVDYIYGEDCFIFCEYTRTVHDKAYVWKVTKPFTDPDNWRIVKEFDVDENPLTGFKHCHTINFDPFSRQVVLTTGDYHDAPEIYVSSDLGETWDLHLGGMEQYCRVLNFVFLKDAVYWGTDSGHTDMHYFHKAPRNSDGTLNFTFENIETLYKFPNVPGVQATYTTAYIRDPEGLLFLDRYDTKATTPMKVYFWSFDTSSMHVIKEIGGIGDEPVNIGFRCDAVNWYQPKTDDRLVVGFNSLYNPNVNDLLGNNEENRINNLTLKVIEK